MRICIYCLIERPVGETCTTCGQAIVEKAEFMQKVNLPMLRASREHWANLDHRYTQGEECKATRLANFDRIIAEVEQAHGSDAK